MKLVINSLNRAKFDVIPVFHQHSRLIISQLWRNTLIQFGLNNQQRGADTQQQFSLICSQHTLPPTKTVPTHHKSHTLGTFDGSFKFQKPLFCLFKCFRWKINAHAIKNVINEKSASAIKSDNRTHLITPGSNHCCNQCPLTPPQKNNVVIFKLLI